LQLRQTDYAIKNRTAAQPKLRLRPKAPTGPNTERLLSLIHNAKKIEKGVLKTNLKAFVQNQEISKLVSYRLLF
jgi:hypothetical protein